MASDGPTPTTLRRPILKAGLRRLQRGPATVQFGIDPDRALVLTDLDIPAADLIAELDGRTPRPHHRDLLATLDGHGLLEDGAASCPGWRALPAALRDRLLPDLASLSLLDPGPDGGKRALSHRFAANVEIRGGGRVGASVAALLAAAGIGEVRVRDDRPTRPADLAPAGLRNEALGRPRGPAATPDPLPLNTVAAARRARPRIRASRREAVPGPRDRRGSVDLVVLTADDGILPDSTDLRGARVPHLVASVAETAGTVGPLVVPGRTSCLRCHDLIRTDRDPDWPALAAQLARPGAPGTRAACDVVLATAVASHAALQVLAFLDTGCAQTLDATLHLRLPEGTVRRRSWQVHPACGCTWLA